MPYFHPRPPRGILSIATTVHSPTHGKNHHGGLHHWVSAQERSEVLNEGVLGIDAVEPIGNAAKLRIEAVDREIEIGYPPLAHP